MTAFYRTLLFVPGNRERMLLRAPSSGADAIVVDLEDAVPAAEKRDARKLVRKLLPRLGESGVSIFVRINDVHSGLARDDVMAVVRPGLAGIVHPKTHQPQDLRDLDVLLREAEMKHGIRPGDVAQIPLIESPRGLLRCEAIADASDRIVALSIGAEDYTAEMGVARDAVAIAHLRYVVATVAAARGIYAIDTPYPNFKDDAGLRTETALVRAIGFKGKYVIHPDQVTPVNVLLSPSKEEVADARRIIAAATRGSSHRRGAVALDGRMIDAPIVARAHSVIDLHERVKP